MSTGTKIIIGIVTAVLIVAGILYYQYYKRISNEMPAKFTGLYMGEYITFQKWVNSTKGGKLRTDGTVDEATRRAMNKYQFEYKAPE